MDNKETTITGLQQNFAKGLQMLTDMSMATIKSAMENSTKTADGLNKVIANTGLLNFTIPDIFGTNKTKDCCVPQDECPPHCILQIQRHAVSGERIIVPFVIKNTCSAQKNYKVGIRELKNIDGTLAPDQPKLNKNAVSLQPGAEEMVLMEIDLANFNAGTTYNAEIVIREKDINQNICFTLVVDGINNAPVAKPQDEKKYNLRWQSWKNHYYCEPPKRANG
jgi:hypothetical protein